MDKELEIYDVVQVPDGRFGTIQDINKNRASVLTYRDDGDLADEEEFSLRDLKLVPKTMLDEDDFKALFRCETTIGELTGCPESLCNWEAKGDEYALGIEDVETALCNLQASKATAKRFHTWTDLWNWDLNYKYEWPEEDNFDADHNWLVDPPRNESDLMFAFYMGLIRTTNGCIEGRISDDDTHYLDYAKVLSDIEAFKNGDADGIRPHRWSEEIGRTLVLGIKDDELIKLDEEALEDYRNILEALVKKDDPEALEIWGYAHYGEGSAAYATDWAVAKEAFVKLMGNPDVDDVKKGVYANTLGYMSYYGYVDGKSDYDEAYKFFSIGLHSAGAYESAYKLADLYLSGKGVARNQGAAYNLVSWDYEHCLEDFCRGGWKNAGNKFADTALRLARFYREGIVVAKRPYFAYRLLTQAEFAMRRRVEAGGYIGDASVSARIDRELASIRWEYEDAEPAKWIKSYFPGSIRQAVSGGRAVRVSLKRNKTFTRLEASCIADSRGLTKASVLVTYPEYRYCRLHDKIVEQARGDVETWLLIGMESFEETGKAEFMADDVRPGFDEDDQRGWAEFLLYGNVVARIRAKQFRFQVDWKGAGVSDEKCIFAKVAFEHGGPTYDYLCEDPEIHEGDHVVVDARGEMKEVEVVSLFSASKSEMPLAPDRYKKIACKAPNNKEILPY